MKTAVLALAAAGAVVAQNFSGEPSCAIPCLTSAISAVGCKLDDQACQCGPSQAAIGTKVLGCFATACSPSDIGVAASVGASLCAAFSKTAGSGVASTTTTTTGTVTGGPSTVSTIISTTSESHPGTLITPPPIASNASFSHSGPTSTKSTSSTPNAAATAGALGFGFVAALLGAAAAL